MSKILDEVDNLVFEVLGIASKAISLVSLATLMAVSIYIGVPLLVALTKTILQYLLFCILATGGVSFAIFSYNKLKYFTDIDEFLETNFQRLELNGYNNIKIIKDKSIKSRDETVKKCNDQIIEQKEGNVTFYILKAKCAISALKAYMKTCLVELYVYYIKLLAAKGIDCKKASSYEYILSFQEEPTFNLVLNSFQNRFNEILDLLKEDQKEFNAEVLLKVKSEISNIDIKKIQPPVIKPQFSIHAQRPQFQRR
jgi:hypothetical protein